MNKYVLPLNEVDDLASVADSLSSLLALVPNSDILKVFPAAVGKYAGDAAGLAMNLSRDRARFEAGEYEDFVCFAGETAVGMAQVARSRLAAGAMEPGEAVLSSYICWPWRGQGLARLSRTRRLKAVDKHFDGTAWTVVKTDNLVSKRLVLSSGFKPIGYSADTYYYNSPRFAQPH
jgi:hypothetical protein